MRNETIERLRAKVAETPGTGHPSRSEVAQVVQGIRNRDQLDKIAQDSGLAAEVVLEITAEFGTWLTRVNRGATADTVTIQEARRQSVDNSSDHVVTVPEGFERSKTQPRRLNKSLASIVVNNPGDEQIDRWMARRYPPDTAVLTYPMVSAIWKFAQIGRLDEIDEVSPHRAFRKPAVEAFDLLCLAIRDAQAASEAITKLSREPPERILDARTALRTAATNLRWLQPREMADLIEMIDLADTPAVSDALVARVKTLARLIDSDPTSWVVETIEELNQGHVEQIAHQSGLSIEGASHTDEAAIRERLTALGLDNDADQLVPEGLRALNSGVIDQFWEAMELRAAGDTRWRDVLTDAYAD